MLDAAEKATGRARYTDDLTYPGMLHGKILRSPLPHAKILHVDLSAAMKVTGVRGAICGKDIPRKKYGIVPMAKDEYALAIDKVRYIGDDVAAVVATSLDAAEEAISKIRVDYEELPAVFDPLESMKPGAPVIHEEVPNNVSATIRKEFGDVEKAFHDSEFISEDTFETQADQSLSPRAPGRPCHGRPFRKGNPLVFDPDPVFLRDGTWPRPSTSLRAGSGSSNPRSEAGSARRSTSMPRISVPPFLQ